MLSELVFRETSRSLVLSRYFKFWGEKKPRAYCFGSLLDSPEKFFSKGHFPYLTLEFLLNILTILREALSPYFPSLHLNTFNCILSKLIDFLVCISCAPLSLCTTISPPSTARRIIPIMHLYPTASIFLLSYFTSLCPTTPPSKTPSPPNCCVYSRLCTHI